MNVIKLDNVDSVDIEVDVDNREKIENREKKSIVNNLNTKNIHFKNSSKYLNQGYNKLQNRKITNKWKNNKDINIEDIIYNYTKQYELLHEIYMDIDNENDNTSNSSKTSKTTKTKIYKDIIISELKHKLNNYKQQDIDKKCYDNYYFIDINKVIELLILSKMKCYYCNNPVLILYENVRENTQWTLDRINNDYGHNKNNCYISCLKCNIQRKLMNDDKFKFSKQMKIKKI